MPELPEVETIVRRLAQVLPGKTIRSFQTLHPKIVRGDTVILENATIERVERRAKIIVIRLRNAHALLIHLKMTGQLIYQDDQVRVGGGHPTADWIAALPTKHTRAIFQFSDASQLFFNDMRIFGWIRIMGNQDVSGEFQQYGPDVIDAVVTAEYVAEKFASRSIPVKQAVMDNAVMAGVGNIYANDALFVAGIDPRRSAQSLSTAEIVRLHQALRQVIELGIELGGATIDHYRHVDGFAGKYQDQVQVYQREGEACKVCGETIIRIKQAGRSTFYCPHCQR